MLDLNAIKTQLEEIVAEGLNPSKLQSDGAMSDKIDEAVANVAEHVNVTIFVNSALKFRQAQAALRRMEDGSYGICANCEKEIGEKRLKAVPWTPLCIVCAENADGLDYDCEPNDRYLSNRLSFRTNNDQDAYIVVPGQEGRDIRRHIANKLAYS